MTFENYEYFADCEVVKDFEVFEDYEALEDEVLEPNNIRGKYDGRGRVIGFYVVEAEATLHELITNTKAKTFNELGTQAIVMQNINKVFTEIQTERKEQIKSMKEGK